MKDKESSHVQVMSSGELDLFYRFSTVWHTFQLYYARFSGFSSGHDQLKPLGVTLSALELSTYDNRAEHSGTDSYL
jgi:hypothetical protein